MCGPRIGDAFFVSRVFPVLRLTAPHRAHDILHAIHATTETPMSAKSTITPSKRLAGIRRFAAPACLATAGGKVCVDARRLGVLPSDQTRRVAGVAPRVRLVEVGNAVVEGQHDEQTRKTSFNADVRIGAGPG